MTAYILLWLCAVLLICPPAAFLAGLLLQQAAAIDPPRLLHVSLLAAAVLTTALFPAGKKQLAEMLTSCRPDRLQLGIVVCFALLVALPRCAAIGPDLPVAVYDDNWHLQKAVSVFATFPDLKHYLFPDRDLSYYFYAYMIPAAVYSIKTGLNLKAVWGAYVFTVALCVSYLLLVCFNAFLPQRGRSRLLFALAITALGGLHEWPCIVTSWITARPNWHTEWWATAMGLSTQISSLYSTDFWAPQHACGLALFGPVFYLLQKTGPRIKSGLLCGLLVGIQAGFSVYVALFTGIFFLLYLAAGRCPGLKERIMSGALFGAGLAASLAPLAPRFIGQQGTLFWAANVSRVPHYLLFLAVEFGALIILYALYAFPAADDRGRAGADRRVHTLFILLTCGMLFCFQSRGFNVFSYRSMLPAQVLLYWAAARSWEGTARLSPLLRRAVIAMLYVQMTGFVPELMAMTKKHLDCRSASLRLPGDILSINSRAGFTDVFTIPYRRGISGPALNVYLHHIFRLKDVPLRFYCEGKIDRNNLVYLNSAAISALNAACRERRLPP